MLLADIVLFAVYATTSTAAASLPLNCIPFPHSNGHAPNKIKDKEPNNCILGCKLKESYYDPRIRVFVILLSLSVKCLDPSFAVDGTKYLLTLLELQKVIIPTYCVQEQCQQKMV